MSNGSHDSDQNKKKIRQRRNFSIRINVFFFAVFLLFSVLIIRLAFLQFVEGEELSAIEKRNLRRDVTISPIRGNIYDQQNYPIASTTSTQSLSYRMEPGPTKEERIELAYKLEEIFQKFGDSTKTQPTAEEIIELMDVGHDINGEPTKEANYAFWPRRIKSGLTKEEIAYISEHRDELPGVEVAEESTRVYDHNQIAVQLVGYLRPYSTAVNQQSKPLQIYKGEDADYRNDEYVGFDGLELMYQDVLRGENGRRSYPVNNRDQIVGHVQITPPVKGNNLHLTIHSNVQLATQQAITDHLQLLQTTTNRTYARGRNAVAGYAVAIEVDSGRVIAMASMPDYDPNVWIGGIGTDTWNEITHRYTNGTIRERYADLPADQLARHPSSLVPPGSVIKPLTVLVGLNEGLFRPNDTYNDTGLFTYGRNNNAKVGNSGGARNGRITPARAIQVSSNTFMAEMVGNKLYMTVPDALNVWDSYMKKFGLGVSTESGLPWENPGDIYYFSTAERLQAQFPLVNASFGQEGRYTTLQLAQYAAMLANQGIRYKPLFVDRITTYEGELVEEIQPEILNQEEFPQAYWNVLKEGMRSAVDGFDNVPYTYVRKTGTSEWQVGGQNVDNAVFIGYAPAENPKIAVAVVVPEGGFGAYGAAPIARKIFDAYDQYIGLDGVPKGASQGDEDSADEEDPE
ncbi:peptidoglycan D,D-transpeptidase FtsI family protein [Paenibacillus senegalensis]|uniref:peptidoglycan D,D-transpeptidase FtsI family protein n=1 Tax=Paenibacillus senegalensis TaxID=1465766 RepID=UPI000287F3CE|nr:penicillin-binding transpeptidase domain-containing protein [Paenibacillus senegalensis]